MPDLSYRSFFEQEYDRYLRGITIENVDELAKKMKICCVINGILFVNRENNRCCHHIPVTLFPTPFPKIVFQKVRNLQFEVNILLHKISNDYDFLEESLKPMFKTDDFIKKLVDIMLQVKHYKYRQKIEVGIIRSDYMIEDQRKSQQEQQRAYLVEYNTISVSFGAHGSQIQGIHSEILNHAAKTSPQDQPEIERDQSRYKITEDIAMALMTGWTEYTKLYNVTNTCILFVVQPNERNIYDHAKIEKATLKLINSILEMQQKTKDIPAIFYVTLEELRHRLETNQNDGSLKFTPFYNNSKPYEVAIVYYRSGYSPQDYKFDYCWNMRKQLELSRAIKIPTIGLQLAGCKKIQQLLSSVSAMQKFVPEEIARDILETYNGIYSMDKSNPEYDRLVELIKSNPDNYVLKPQREGGGNNIYGKDIITLLENAKAEDKSTENYILMEMIHPTAYRNYLILPDHPEAVESDCVGELGVWGIYVQKDESMLLNVSSGYIFRSKVLKELDGGVASGRAVLDSVVLY